MKIILITLTVYLCIFTKLSRGRTSQQVHHQVKLTSMPFVSDDTTWIESKSSHCAVGNYQLRCTAWGIRQYLSTTVMEIQGDIMSCVRLRQWRDKCYWGIYKDSQKCCDEKPDEPFSSGGSCDCRGDFPMSQQAEDRRYTVLQAHYANATCLYNWSVEDPFRPCRPESKSQMWRFIERVDKDVVSYQLMGAIQDNCLSSEADSMLVFLFSPSLGMEDCKNRDHDPKLLWEVVELSGAGQGFLLLKSKKSDRCMSAGSNNRIEMKDCSVDDQAQWWMTFNLLGKKITADEKDEDSKAFAPTVIIAIMMFILYLV